jgi:hypothetical protein
MKPFQESINKFCKTLLILGLLFTPITGYAKDKTVINNGNPVEKVKDDERGYIFIQELIATEAVSKGDAKDIAKAAKRFRKYSKELAKVLSQYSYAEQQRIIFGSL